jgi:hypothetical protein
MVWAGTRPAPTILYGLLYNRRNMTGRDSSVTAFNLTAEERRPGPRR